MAFARILLLIGVVTLQLFAQTSRLPYPPAPRTEQIDDYHGTKIADPYRTLENADAHSTSKWIERENALTFSWLAKLPGRENIRTQLTSLWNYERFPRLYKAGGHYFYLHNSGLQNQSVLYVLDSLSGSPRELLDPNTYLKDGTAALNGESVSWSGKLMAYAMAQAGSDWKEWRVRDVATGKDLPDLLRWSKAESTAWAPDDSGFYYTRFPEPPADKVLTATTLNEKVYFHKLGDPQQADKVIYERPDHPNWTFGPQVMEGGKILVFDIYTGVPGTNLLAWRDLNRQTPAKDLIATALHGYQPIEVAGSLLYLLTNDGAPRGRVIAMDLLQPDRAH